LGLERDLHQQRRRAVDCKRYPAPGEHDGSANVGHAAERAPTLHRHAGYGLSEPLAANVVLQVLHALSVTPLEQILGSRLIAFGAEYLEAEGVGEPVDCVERDADRQRVLDLLASDAGG
jgi:hypothetical protein